MSRIDPPPSPTESIDDARLAERLDEYQQLLDQGQLDGARQYLEAHPQLAPYCECLDALHNLIAPAAGATPRGLATLAFHGDISSGAADSRAGSAADTDDCFPRPFGKYELLEEIGRGGMGVVYRARQTDLDRLVAIKMILPSRIPCGLELRRFYREARSAGCLKHPHVVEIYEVGSHQGQHYFAMTFVDGGSLSDVLGEDRLTAEQAARCLAPIADGVHCLHQHGFVHRDLKPSNILIDVQGRPYVADFGLARYCGPDAGDTRTGTVVGTPGYMAPEQAAGRNSEVSPASDVFSLGAILYQMLTGRPPFSADSPWQTVMQVIESEPLAPRRLNRQIPYEVELICLRALEKNPALRYPSAAAMAEDLRRFLRHEPVEANAGNLWHRFRRWGRKQPALASHLIGLAVLAVVVQGKYIHSGVDEIFHGRIMGIIGIWIVISFVFQRWVERNDSQVMDPALAEPAPEVRNSPRGSSASDTRSSIRNTPPPATDDLPRYGWAAADVILLTALLAMIAPPVGPLLIGFPVLIAAAGLFNQVRLVTCMTGLCTLGYVSLLVLRPDMAMPIHYAILFALLLMIVGGIVGYQVYRLRILSRYFERHQA